MPNIPLYQERSAPTTSTPVREISGAPAANIGKAVAGMGAQVFSMGKEYIDKKNALKEKADIADYEVMRKRFETELGQKKNDALMSGMSYMDVYDKVISPEMSTFEEKINSRGYGKSSKSNIGERWQLDSEDIRQKEITAREKMELNDYVARISSRAEMLMDTDKEAAESLYDDIAGVIGEAGAEQMKSKGRYNSFSLRMVNLEQLALSGEITEDEYKQELDIISSEIKDSGMKPEHEKPLLTQSTAKQNSYIKKKQKEQSSAISEFRRVDKAGNLDGAELEKLERTMGADYSNALVKLNYESMRKGAVDDADLAEAFALVNKFATTTDMDFYKTIKKAEQIGGKAGKRAFWQISEIYKERIDKDVEIGTPLQSYRTDFFEQVTRFVATGDKVVDWYDDRMLKFEKWVGNNPDATMDEYYDFRYKELKTDVADFVGKITAPQQPALETNEAPQEAIDMLMGNPAEYSEFFESKYGYLPEGI